MTEQASRSVRRRRPFARLLLTEGRLALREPIGIVLGLALPVALLLIFSAIPKFREPQVTLGGLTWLDMYVPVLIVFGLTMTALVGMPGPLASYRDRGVLRRMATTPVPPSRLLLAELLIYLAIAAVGILLTLGIAVFAYRIRQPGSGSGFALAVILTAAALFAIGLWITAIARSAQMAAAIGNLLFFPLIFFAGLWIPRQVMPGYLRAVSDYTPLGASVQAMQSAMGGSFPSARALLVLAAYGVVFGILAVRSFRWE